MAGRSAWRCKVIADNPLRRCRPPPNTMFSMAVWRGTVAGPLHWRAGWQTGSLPRLIALDAYFCQETVHSNYPNETMSTVTGSAQQPSACALQRAWLLHLLFAL